jgi:hypothetical protein
MAYDNDQNEFPINPDGENEKRTSLSHLPRYFRTPANKKFLSSTIDQLVQPGVVEKLNAYYGRRDAKAFTADDNYVGDVTKQREDYQVEPAVVLKDDVDNVTFYKDYNDFINQLRSFGNNNPDHSKINAQEYYAWNPHIDWDKFVNFREYYWLPSGPQVLPIYGQSKEIVSTFKVSLEENADNVAYKFTPTGLTQNPTLKLYKGQTYIFEIDTPGHPIAFATNRAFTPGQAIITETVEGVLAPGKFEAEIYDSDGYDTGEYIVEPVEGGITGFTEGENISTLFTDGVESATVFVEKGTLKFTVPLDAPDRLFYISKNDVNTSGVILMYNILENTEINVEEEILQKKTYTTRTDVDLSNGMLVEFLGDVTPAKYGEGTWYVEGVGESIQLIKKTDLEITGEYSANLFVPFDSENFDKLPFGQALNYPKDKDYITINRAAIDGNPWSRHNRWFHRDTIESTAKANGTQPDLDQAQRAKRPIIEFDAGLRLYNFGSKFKANVDLIDDKTIDVFSTIEGSIGYNIDGIDLIEGQRILFTADPDIRVNGRIYKVSFINQLGTRQLALREETDTEPVTNETVLVRNGIVNQGKVYWYNGTKWIKGQDKLKANQAPLFDLYDATNSTFQDYSSNTFKGTKLFSYKVGTGTNDSELGFPLSYRNIENSGDIVFDFNLLNDEFTYQSGQVNYTQKTDVATLRKYTDLNVYTNVSGWKKAPTESKQKVIRAYVVSGKKNNFAVDVYNNSGDLNQLEVKVFVNNARRTDWGINRENGTAYITFDKDLTNGDNVILHCTSEADKNDNGHYAFPINLGNNPLNENIKDFTYGEVADHVTTIIENVTGFSGTYPGSSNLRNLGQLSEYGTKFVQHSGPATLASYHITNKNYNIVKALRFARKEYAKFKRSFLAIANELGIDGSSRYVVDEAIKKWQSEKSKQTAFYWSDMIGNGANKKRSFTVTDIENKFYSLTTPFTLNSISAIAVYVYLNDTQLLHNRDYVFTAEGFIKLTDNVTLAVDDTIDIYEYDSTDASYIPPTPTKLGLWPLHIPAIYVDDSYQTSQTVIKGHDGSIVKAYGDYRDNLLLELELRIYNNIKVKYDTKIFDVDSFIGHYSRNTGFDTEDLNDIIITDFADWLSVAGDPDYTDISFYDRTNSFTWNYSYMTDPNGKPLPGFWRAIYNDYLGTDTPHTTPWKILGYVDKPEWWETVYGAAPYTKENLILWEDLQEGRVRQPLNPIRYRPEYARRDLLKYTPVNSRGELLSPYESGFAQGLIVPETNRQFVFGDQAPTETAWRRGSEYPFAFLTAWLIHQPSKVIGIGFDRSRIIRNTAGELIYTGSNKRLKVSDLIFPNTSSSTVRTSTAGLVNYVFNYINADVTKLNVNYSNEVSKLNVQLGFKIGGFSTKDKFRLVLDSRTPNNKGNVFIPEENYDLFLNTSSPIDTVSYSGVIIEKRPAGYIVKGYDRAKPYFSYYKHLERAKDPVVNIGGVSESFLEWVPGERYQAGQIVRNGQTFFRVQQSGTFDTFIQDNFVKLVELPIEGGRTIILRREFETATSKLNYGTLFTTVQGVVDFLLGYGKFLEKQGFVFDRFNGTIETVENWELSAREFTFWTTQNWNNGALLTLSPSAINLNFKREYAVVDNIFDNFYDYTLLKADGQKLQEDFANTIRSSQNEFGLTLKNTADGIYFVKLPLVQKEHVCLIDNKTVFNDTIYNPAPGYRQARIKVLGYRSTDWNGGVNIPGFTLDSVNVVDWKENTDYQIADVVYYKTRYYSAKTKIPGSTVFNADEWYLLNEKPSNELIPNFDYKANQFADFYDLDTDNFDSEQQRMAQHLIGYQKRTYLENIINDDVSQYKFYQGFIQDKGTKNSLEKLFDALSNTENSSLEFFEDWAFKVGQYGASESFDEVEYEIDESKFRLSPQPFQLVQNIDPQATDLVYRYTPVDLYSKPAKYDHKPFPTKYVAEDSSYIKTAGYVAEEDINYKVTNYDDILNLDLNTVEIGQYVWVAKKGQTWDVLRQTETDMKVSSIINSDSSKSIEIKTKKAPDTQPGDIIGVLGVGPKQNRFYKVLRVSLDVIYAQTTGEVEDAPEASGFILKLVSSRVANLTDVNSKITRDNYSTQERVWVDYDENNRWTVVENQNTYSIAQQVFNTTVAGVQDTDVRAFGTSISSNTNNTIIAVGSPAPIGATELRNGQTKPVLGRVDVHFRASENINLILSQSFDCPENYFDNVENFGKSTAVSSDGKWIFVGIPYASNVKTKYKGPFVSSASYQKDEIVEYTNQYWKAKNIIEPTDPSLDFPSFSSHLRHLISTYDANTQQYDNVYYILRGNFTFQEETTDHVLIRAPRLAYVATTPGDTLQLFWNDINTRYPSGVQPFNGNPTINKTFFDGNHTIADKVDDILLVDNTQAIPSVGETISSATAVGVVAFTYTTGDNRTLIYVKDANGDFESTGTLFVGDISVGAYERAVEQDYDALGGWWKINVGSTFQSIATIETKPYLVIQDVIQQGVVRNPNYYQNVLRITDDATSPTITSYIESLTFTGDSGDELSDKWVFRAPRTLDTDLTVGSTFNFFFNEYRNADNVLQDPTAIGSNITHDYLNNTLHTVNDIWDGWIDVNLTNFDDRGSPTPGDPDFNPNYGNPFIPVVGDTVQDNDTLATGQVVYLEKVFNSLRVWIKNKTGTWKLGNENQAISSLSIVGGSQGVGVIRLVGTTQDVHLQSQTAGYIVVVDRGENIPRGTSRTLQGFEYWIYKSILLDGIARSANPPSKTNNDWTRVYNIPAGINETSSGLARQGAYAIYQRNASNFFTLIGIYSSPDAQQDRYLGSDIRIVSHTNGTYSAYILSKGNATFNQPGRINILNYDVNNGWKLGADENYRGDFTSTVAYFQDEYVKFNDSVYKAKTNLIPGGFRASDWEEVSTGVQLTGFLPNNTGFIVGTDSAIETENLYEFGTQFDISFTGSVLATVVKYGDAVDSSVATRKLVIYRKSLLGHYVFDQMIDAPYPNINYGDSVAVSTDGKFIAVGAPNYTDTYSNQGTVFIYEQINGRFEQVQHLIGPKGLPNEKFGTVVRYDNDRIVVHSAGGDLFNRTEFDSGTTVFDNGTTIFSSTLVDTGEVFVFELLGNRYVYSDKLEYSNDKTLYFGRTLLIKNNHIYVSLPQFKRDGKNVTGQILDYRVTPNTRLWSRKRNQRPLVDIEKIKGISIYDKDTKILQEYLDYIDPIQGKIAGQAEVELSFKTTFDPSTYNNVDTTDVNKDETSFTSTDMVGKLWWDTDAVRFINPYSNTGNIFNVGNTFNTVFPGTEIEIYEWVETKLTPEEWDAQADTEAGLTEGISGKSKYGIKAYSTKRVYDEPAQKFTTYYYFWVRNKKTVPNLPGRLISAADVQELIREPSGQGYKFINFLNNNEWTAHNLESTIRGKNGVLKFAYWNIDKTDNNIHNQYKLITDGLETSRPKSDLERKWYDSLIGYDEQGREVPDRFLGEKERYGILNNPRQTIFVNRIEALKQFVERVNSVLIKNVLIDDFDLSDLDSNDPIPTLSSRRYDVQIDSDSELQFVAVGRVAKATASATISDGKIIRVDITNPGRGYKTVPTLRINSSTGSDAEIRLEINAIGSVTSATVINSGRNYQTSDTITIRNFTVLTTVDNSYANKWSLYEYVGGAEPWNRIASQRYDVRPYWNYTDWYATNYNTLTKIDYVIDETYELEALDDTFGDIIKIKSVGSGGWLLLRKIDDQLNVDYTINYQTIGRQNATVQLKSSIYDYADDLVGYDSFGYDDSAFDLQPIDELRIVLKALRDKIFVDNLAVHYNELFFAQMRYVLSEQTFVDWMFKTSFVKATHNIGKLRKDITFNNDFLESYENYANEVKPYKTKIREYLSTYEGSENSQTMVTDFDLPPAYDEQQGRIVPQNAVVVNDELRVASNLINSYPYKHWADNASYEIKDITIFDAGAGYENAPGVEFVGGGGSGATAIAYVGGGKITEIKITNPGTGYLSAPKIVLNGNVADGGRTAKVTAVIGNTNLRTTHFRVKFDRVTGTFFITTLEETETFVGSGSRYTYKLKWPVDVRTDKVKITVGGEEVLSSRYKIENIEDSAGRTHQRYIGKVTFDVPPANNKSIVIDYRKDISLLTAQDRINLFYNPTTGMIANNLGQLLDGIDYGGVQVKSFDFGGGSGWSADEWFTSAYDTYDNTYEDEVFRISDDSTKVYDFAKSLETGVVYNVYKNGVRIDDPNFDTPNQTNPDALITSITGAGQTGFILTDDGTEVASTVIKFDEEKVVTTSGDVIVVRKNTSDGSFIPDPRAYDTIVTGGDLAYSTATGLNPEDINIDGDGFVTPTTSKGPEELVPGQLLDTLDIKVYDRVGEGASIIESVSYVADGNTSKFKFSGLPQGKDAIFVKVDNVIVYNYTVNYKDKELTFNSTPTNNSQINIITMSGNGQGILDMDTFLGDGSTLQFVTQVDWKENLGSLVTVNGAKVDYVLETTDSSYDTANKTVISFGAPPASDAVINFAIYASDAQTFSEIITDNLVADGSSATYNLSLTPFSSLPSSHNIIVKVGDNILNAGYNEKFTIDNRVEYQLRNWQQPGGTLGADDILVVLNGRKLTYTSDFIFRPANSSVEIFENVAQPGDKLDIYVITDGEYSVSGNTITLNTVPAEDTPIKVTHFSKHDIQEINRKNYDIITRTTLTFESAGDIEYNHLLAGLIRLERPTIDAEYVWIVINGELKTPSIDYKVTNDRLFVRMAQPLTANDVIEVIQFAENGPTVAKFGYRQFKDMLNRTVYKRLGDVNNYRLAQDLKVFDTEILVNDASSMFVPDKFTNTPGVLFVNGERIEYMVKDGNSLQQLRRGTMGTGVKEIHNIGDQLFDQGFQQTVPYQDQTLVNTYNGDGSTTAFNLDWEPNSVNEFEVFVGGKRLRKTAIPVFNPTVAQDSPEGDVTAPAEFNISNPNILNLTVAPADGVRVTVIRKIGKIWNEPGKTLGKTQNAIAQFLRAEEVDLPK